MIRKLFRRLAARSAAILAGRTARAARTKSVVVWDERTYGEVPAVTPPVPVDELMAVAEHFDVDPRPTLPDIRPYANGGWSLAGGVMVHRPCSSGYRICAYCSPLLAGCMEGRTR